jgi:hypothetical protein
MSRSKRHDDTGGDGRSRPKTESTERSRSTAFVMTLWLEAGSPEQPPEWRWRVVQVRTGERRYFRRLRDLLAYVGERTGIPPPTLEQRRPR